MDPVSLRRLLGPAHTAAVVMAITVLTSGTSLPVAAATPSTGPEATAPLVAAAVDAGPGPTSLPLRREPDEDEGTARPTDSGPVADARSLAQADLFSGERLTVAAPQPSVRPPSRSPLKPAVRSARPVHRVTPARGHHGRNHVWSSSLGLDRSVSWFPCSRSRPPGPAVYRWGCAGTNNVYLFAHAGGPFQRLHDVYVRGHLRKGMAVTYADAAGRIHRYTVAWWKVVLPTEGDFAFAAQARPSMTLQTCVGPHDRYRLVVRLYLAG